MHVRHLDLFITLETGPGVILDHSLICHVHLIGW